MKLSFHQNWVKTNTQLVLGTMIAYFDLCKVEQFKAKTIISKWKKSWNKPSNAINLFKV